MTPAVMGFISWASCRSAGTARDWLLTREHDHGVGCASYTEALGSFAVIAAVTQSSPSSISARQSRRHRAGAVALQAASPASRKQATICNIVGLVSRARRSRSDRQSLHLCYQSIYHRCPSVGDANRSWPLVARRARAEPQRVGEDRDRRQAHGQCREHWAEQDAELGIKHTGSHWDPNGVVKKSRVCQRRPLRSSHRRAITIRMHGAGVLRALRHVVGLTRSDAALPGSHCAVGSRERAESSSTSQATCRAEAKLLALALEAVCRLGADRHAAAGVGAARLGLVAVTPGARNRIELSHARLLR